MTFQKPVRILRIVSRLNVGGPAQHVILLTQHLQDAAWQSQLLSGMESPEEGNMLDYAGRHEVEVFRLEAMKRRLGPLSDFFVFLQILKIIRSYKPDIVHTHTAKAGALGRIAARLAGVPLVVHTFHGHVFSGYFHPLATRCFIFIERMLARSTDAIVTLTEKLNADLLRLGIIGKRDNRVVPLGLELDGFARAKPTGKNLLGGKSGTIKIGIIGRLVPIKRHDILLEALSGLRTHVPPLELFIIGDGPLRETLEIQSRELALTGIVHFMGFRQDLEELYPELDLVVLSSANEGMPVCLLEAMASGIPVLATAVGGVEDLLSDCPSCKLVHPENAEALRSGIEEIVPALGDLKKKAEIHRKVISERYGVQNLVKSLKNLYVELMEAR